MVPTQSRAVVRRTGRVCRRGLLCFVGLLVLGLVFALALLAPWWGGPAHAQEPTATTSPTDTPEATEAPTPTASPTETPMPAETATETPTEVPTETPAPTKTATPTPTELPTETATEASPPTYTPTTTPTTTPTPYQGLPPSEPVMAPSFMQAAVEWTTPIPVAVTANDSENPVIALDAQGNPHVAWSEKRSDADWDIYYSRWGGTSWTGPFAVTATTSWSMRPHLAVDNAGLVHIVWEDDRDGQIKILDIIEI